MDLVLASRGLEAAGGARLATRHGYVTNRAARTGRSGVWHTHLAWLLIDAYRPVDAVGRHPTQGTFKSRGDLVGVSLADTSFAP